MAHSMRFWCHVTDVDVMANQCHMEAKAHVGYHLSMPHHLLQIERWLRLKQWDPCI